ncbi:MAG TPA: tetratricopeptide repeat protein [Sphingobacteriaceae bacterium]
MSHDAANVQHDDTSVWDVRSVRALLHAQTWKLDEDPWSSWIQHWGGIETVRFYLKTCPLSADHQELLDLVLSHPGENVNFYITHWRPMHRATFAEYVTKLCTTLANHLNTWVLKESEPAYSEQAPFIQSRPRSLKNLPAPVTSFVGRHQELLILHDLLNHPHIRMVTLTGPGGTGKTRLALHAAEQFHTLFSDGVFFIPLATIQQPAMVLSAIAEALQIEETHQRPISARVHEFLADQQILLVLDNFEHVIEAAAVVSDLLQASRQLKILVTSREKLHLSGEHECIVSPLALPQAEHEYDIDDLVHVPAIALFLDRAQNVKPAFSLDRENAPIITDICRTLDGLPLAIELAAAQSKHLSPARILERLTNRFDALTHGPRDLPSRQQTLRATIDWSYDLLDEHDQMLFRRLGVFVGGWSLEGVETICSEPKILSTNLFDLLISLVDKSLVLETEIDDEQRFTMLETIRAYAVEKLQGHGEDDIFRERHANYYLALVKQAEDAYSGPQHVLWLNRLEQEHDNLRAALDWTLRHQKPDVALRLSGGLWCFWLIRGYLSEGRHWLKQAIDTGAECSDEDRVKALDGSGVLAMFQGDYAIALAYSEEALTLFRRLGNSAGESDILESLGVLHIFLGDYTQAMQRYAESLAIRRTLGDVRRISSSLTNLGYIALTQAEYEQAQTYTEESLALSRRSGDLQGIAISLCNLGLVAITYHRDFQAAYRLYKESLEVVGDIQDKEVMITGIAGLSLVAFELGELDRAARIFGAITKWRAIFGVAPSNDPVQDTVHQAMLRTHEQLGEVLWMLLEEEGRAMTLEEVITHALQIKTLPEAVQSP